MTLILNLNPSLIFTLRENVCFNFGEKNEYRYLGGKTKPTFKKED